MFSTIERRRGMTLIELLLVLVIIATLAALVAPSLVGKSRDASIKACQGQLSHLEEALGYFEQDYQRYPTTEEGLEVLVSVPPLPNGESNDRGYLQKSVPTDPWGNPYRYECPGSHNSRFVDISSGGPDGKLDTEDDVTNWQD
jgi:general secretion pathway protein G